MFTSQRDVRFRVRTYNIERVIDNAGEANLDKNIISFARFVYQNRISSALIQHKQKNKKYPCVQYIIRTTHMLFECWSVLHNMWLLFQI